MVSDPLDALLTELLEAHDRQQAEDGLAQAPVPGPPRARAPRLRSAPRLRLAPPPRLAPRRLVALGALLTALTSSAVAAAIVLSALPSAPLAGRLPHQLLGLRYSLRVSPDLRAGSTGWCVTLFDSRVQLPIVTGTGGCVSGSGPLITRGGVAEISPRTGAVSGWLLYAVVDRRVATLQVPGGARVVPIAGPGLPAGWRAAVTLTTRPPSKLRHATAIALSPLDRHGRALSPVIAPPLTLPSRAISPGRPPAAGCRISVASGSAVRLLSARVLSATPPRALPAAGGLLTCYSLSFELHGRGGVAALLLNARASGAAAQPIPGLTPLRSHAGVWVGSAAPQGSSEVGGELFARRVGNGWLVLQGPDQADAVTLLQRLRASA